MCGREARLLQWMSGREAPQDVCAREARLLQWEIRASLVSLTLRLGLSVEGRGLRVEGLGFRV